MKINFEKYVEIFRAISPSMKEWEMRNLHITFAIYKNKLIAAEFNKKKTHTINLKNRKINELGKDISNTKYTCSEWRTLRYVKNKTNIPFGKIILINMRLDRNNRVCFSGPCMSCLNLIRFCSPKAVYYSNDMGEFKKLKYKGIYE